MGCFSSKNRVEDVRTEAIRKIEENDLSNNNTAEVHPNNLIKNNMHSVETANSESNVLNLKADLKTEYDLEISIFNVKSLNYQKLPGDKNESKLCNLKLEDISSENFQEKIVDSQPTAESISGNKPDIKPSNEIDQENVKKICDPISPISKNEKDVKKVNGCDLLLDKHFEIWTVLNEYSEFGDEIDLDNQLINKPSQKPYAVTPKDETDKKLDIWDETNYRHDSTLKSNNEQVNKPIPKLSEKPDRELHIESDNDIDDEVHNEPSKPDIESHIESKHETNISNTNTDISLVTNNEKDIQESNPKKADPDIPLHKIVEIGKVVKMYDNESNDEASIGLNNKSGQKATVEFFYDSSFESDDEERDIPNDETSYNEEFESDNDLDNQPAAKQIRNKQPDSDRERNVKKKYKGIEKENTLNINEEIRKILKGCDELNHEPSNVLKNKLKNKHSYNLIESSEYRNQNEKNNLITLDKTDDQTIASKREKEHKPKIVYPALSLDEQVEEWKALIETLTNNKKLMSYALARPRSHFKLVSDVGEYLAGCRETQSEIEKAWIVYVWITHNIAYDVESFLNSNYRFCSPQSVLERGLAVCSGYANLYKTLCTQLGVACISISGYSKGFGYKVGSKMTEENHAWNAITCVRDGKLRFIESTWGAGHLSENSKFEKKFIPHYFAVPAHIFNETHHSKSFRATDGTKMLTLEEFENCANNELEYHVLGLSCLNNTVKAITKTNKNPLVIEYTSSQRIYFSTKLIDERTGRETKNAAVVQSEYSMFKQIKSKYCLIINIPEKGRNYNFKLYAKNKDSSEDGGKGYPNISEFIVFREGDEESYIPQYKLSFAYGIKLKSHYCQFIKFKTNPLIMEFEVPNNVKTLFKVVTMDDNKIEDAVLAQINPENSKTNLQVVLPRKNEKFNLRMFAKNSRDQDFMYDYVSQFFLIRTQSNRNDALKFCKVYTIGENCFIYSPIEYYLTPKCLYEF